ncbi:type II CRISPR RNA-guided endonuclease Cas9 [Carnobacterium gallinarum]|uniref:type II CRISPR RNA-guided endonuclease Cas9 n=1 Tax=Carnobacterium gallinarum TaxID=2749 RepID=UPI00054DF1AE|nr:type II CRISPR RNA-guided endonuclease Cas9 [Carnobacterium gallinarum]
MGYRIGLDIGITSIGYAILKTDNTGNPYKIEQMNSIIFPAAEHPKTGKSLALPRREQRGARRRNRRRKFRKYRTKMLFIKHHLLTKNQMEMIYTDSRILTDIYELRKKALDERISNEELYQILYFFAGHRGFKSNRKSELTEKDMGTMLTAIKGIEEVLRNGTYRTLGEYMYMDAKYQEHKRNKEGLDRYLGTAKRALVEDEIKQILTKQFELGNLDLTKEFEEAFIGDEEKTGIFNDQRDFEDGPGKQSPYAGNQVEKMIGDCTFEKDEKRAPKASFTFQYFDLLSKINQLRYRERIGSDYQELTSEQRELLKEKVLTTQKVTFAGVKKLLGLSPYTQFNLLNYGTKTTQEETESKTNFYSLLNYHKLKKTLPETFFKSLSVDQIDVIAYVLTVYSSDHRRRDEFYGRLALPEEIVDLLLPLNFSKFGNLSLTAMKKIIPYLETGKVYSEAAGLAGYDFRYKQIDEEYIEKNVNNPVVKRAVKQAIKLVKNIERQYGYPPDALNIELAREMGKTFADRRKVMKFQEEGRRRNEQLAERIRDLGQSVNGENITRLKLYEEQNGFDPYTGNTIPCNQIFSDVYDVDHIIPYSKTLDDSFGNKVLVSSAANKEKGNRIPMDYIGGNPERRKKLETIANSIKNPKKREKLLKEELTKEDMEGWKARNLNDTRYISKLLYDYFRQTIQFPELAVEKKKRVFAINGSVTAKLRARWGFNKVRANGDEHHALDALVVACVTDKYIQEVTKYSKRKEVRENSDLWRLDETPEAIEADVVKTKTDYNRIFNQAFPTPWVNFREETRCRMSGNPSELMKNYTWETYTDEEIADLKPIFIVRLPKMKTKGAAHEETLRSGKLYEQGLNISRVSVSRLKLDKNGVIKSGNAEFYQADGNGWKLVHEKLTEALLAHGGDGSKAFPEGFLQYTHEGKEYMVRKVRVVGKSSLQVPLNTKLAVADNGSMIRIDIFRTENGKYQFVPIYVSDKVKETLPNQASAGGKNSKDWPVVKPEDFLFSLYPNDLIRIKHKKGVKHTSKDGNKEVEIKSDFFAYYKGANISTASISGINHNNFFEFEGVGLATLISLEKYRVDYFGNYYKVNEKIRQEFHKK